MVLLENDTFLTELTKMFQKSRNSGTVTLTMKRYFSNCRRLHNSICGKSGNEFRTQFKHDDGKTKPKSRKGNQPEPSEYKCLVRASLGNKKLSTVINHGDINKFQMAYCNLLKGNMDGLKKRDKKTGKSKVKATQ